MYSLKVSAGLCCAVNFDTIQDWMRSVLTQLLLRQTQHPAHVQHRSIRLPMPQPEHVPSENERSTLLGYLVSKRSDLDPQVRC